MKVSMTTYKGNISAVLYLNMDFLTGLELYKDIFFLRNMLLIGDSSMICDAFRFNLLKGRNH